MNQYTHLYTHTVQILHWMERRAHNDADHAADRWRTNGVHTVLGTHKHTHTFAQWECKDVEHKSNKNGIESDGAATDTVDAKRECTTLCAFSFDRISDEYNGEWSLTISYHCIKSQLSYVYRMLPLLSPLCRRCRCSFLFNTRLHCSAPRSLARK